MRIKRKIRSISHGYIRKPSSGYQLVLGYLGRFIVFIGVITLLPLLTLFFYPQETAAWSSFVVPGAGSIIIGLTLYFIFGFKRETGHLEKHQDAVLLCLIWLAACAIGALPFFFVGLFNSGAYGAAGHEAYSYTEAFFESTSGYCTAGFSIFRDFLDSGTSTSFPYDAFCPHPFLMYRSLIQFFGGVGLVLIVTSVLSDRYGMRLYNGEGHTDKLMPNMSRSARAILLIYSAYILLGTLFLWLFGLPVFDSLNNSISALATGGFSTYSTSITYFIQQNAGSVMSDVTAIFKVNPVGIEITMCILMLLGGTSFLLHMSFLTFKWKKFFKDTELRFFALFALIMIPLMALAVLKQGYESGDVHGNYFQALHLSMFQFISCVTTSGFSTVANITRLGTACMLLSVICMSIGGGMGSTAGGWKQYRFIVMAKSVYWNLKYKVNSSRWGYPTNIQRNGEVHQVDKTEFHDTTIYMWIYLLTLVVGTILCSFFVDKFEDGLYEFASALSGTGNSVIVFADITDATAMRYVGDMWQYNTLLWILSIGMFLGRLEITPAFFAVMRSGRDILHIETN
ncbi:MAG: TrkH family potassium uptake protein [Bacilli bacterium]|nr:TrkH family potassium uptake protein [Bacilli bacterium]